jgi:uncharacterized protein (TIGR02599 family)
MNALFNSMSCHKAFPQSEAGRASVRTAFSLIELLISLAVLSVLVVLAASLIGAIQDVWKRSSARTEQFRSARQALETISARLSQATLNPYWVVQTNSIGAPIRYERQSDLRFLAGQAPTLTALAQPGSALFFQAPTGYSANGTSRLDAALNTWGYFVEYGSDAGLRPAFLTSTSLPARNRFRLMEFLDPSDELQVFKNTSGKSTYAGIEWFSTPLTKLDIDGTPKNRRVLAENIVAFVALPRLSSVEDRSVGQVDLSPKFSYDSTSPTPVPITNEKDELVQHIIRHQLPPIVDIAVVAIDEQSARRINWDTKPDFGASALFQIPSNMEADLEKLRSNIAAQGLSARVFRTSVPISAARWSTEQAN